MTTINNLEILSLPVAENLNDSLYEVVTLNASGPSHEGRRHY